MNKVFINGNTVAYDKVISSDIRPAKTSAFSPLNISMRQAKALVKGSDCDKAEYRTLLTRTLDAANEIDYTEKSAREVLSEIIIEALDEDTAGVGSVKMRDSLENQLISTFEDKLDVIRILSAQTGRIKDIWLVVEDSLSDSALEYNNLYFELLNHNDYFEFKVLDPYDMESLDHIQTTCLFLRKDVCNAD